MTLNLVGYGGANASPKAEGIPVSVTPGVFLAAAAASRQELTLPGLAQSSSRTSGALLACLRAKP